MCCLPLDFSTTPGFAFWTPDLLPTLDPNFDIWFLWILQTIWIMATRCCVPNCKVSRADEGTTLHHFPNPRKDSDRFRRWLYAIGGDVLSIENEYIYKNRRVCHKHFDEKYHTWTKTLTCDAVPTLFLRGFSEEDLQRIKSTTTTDSKKGSFSGRPRKIDLTSKRKKVSPPAEQLSSDSIDDVQFDKCRLSIKSPTANDPNTQEIEEKVPSLENLNLNNNHTNCNDILADNNLETNNNGVETNKTDMVRGTDYSEAELSVHKAKLEELQLKQKIMEEQNKKRKEMLAKALADRTRQTEEEVMKLEKIKKELQILDGQFSQDVAVLRKKIDQACLSYADAEKHYLRVEKDFLQAKIQLQKEKEKKELLTEHLSALITHNETRKAQKLETLMLELATNKIEGNSTEVKKQNVMNESVDEEPIVIDGVDQRTGKMVEYNAD